MSVIFWDSWYISLAAGTVLGFLTGLGIGGGSLLILWLTVVLGMDPGTARTVNLLFFLPSALIAVVMRIKQGNIPLKKILPAIVSGGVAAGIAAWLSAGLDLDLLKKLFGGLLIVTGLRELSYRKKITGGN